MDKMKPKAYFFLGKTPVADFRPLIREVMAACPFVRHWVQFQKEADLIMEGAVGIAEFVKDIKKVYPAEPPDGPGEEGAPRRSESGTPA